MDKELIKLEKNFLNAVNDENKRIDAMDELMKYIFKRCNTAVNGVSRVTAPFILAALKNECEVLKGLFPGVDEVADEIQKSISNVTVNSEELNKQAGKED